LEATGGYSVQKTDNPLYYQGTSFYNPKQLKNYIQLVRQLNDANQKYKSALDDYNNFLKQYNSAGFLSQFSMKSQLDDKNLIVQQRLQDYNQIISQINALVSNL
jgi:hypothetical protein